MRKVIMLNRISMDGYFASHDEKSWGMNWFVADPAVDQAAHELIQADMLLMGRETYEHFEKSWLPMLDDPKAPKEAKATAKELTDMKKVVFSKSMKAAKWENSELHHGNLAATVRKLKKENGAGILILGSGTIVQQLAEEALIDEYLFILSPVIAGEGKPLFKEVQETKLELVESRAFKSGNLLLHYRVPQA